MTLLISLWLVSLLALAGCGPRIGSAARTSAAGDASVVIDLPAIYIDFDEQGVATTGGLSLAQAGALLGRSLPELKLGASTIQSMQEYNIQHVQLINTPEGLEILVNGLKMPSFAWNAEVLTNLRALLTNVGMDLGTAGGMLPLLGTMGTGIVLRFPLAEGQEPLPLTDPNAAEVAARAQEEARAFVAGVGDVPVIKFSVDYKPDGTWTVQGQGSAEWEEILPIGWDGFDLDPETIQGVVDAGIRTLTVDTAQDGVHIAINGDALPVITWGSGELNNMLELVKRSGILTTVSGRDPQLSGVLDLVESVLPTVQAADFSMTVNFPAP